MFQSDDAAPLERLSTTILDPGLGYKFAAIDSIDLTFEEGFFVFKEFAHIKPPLPNPNTISCNESPVNSANAGTTREPILGIVESATVYWKNQLLSSSNESVYGWPSI